MATLWAPIGKTKIQYGVEYPDGTIDWAETLNTGYPYDTAERRAEAVTAYREKLKQFHVECADEATLKFHEREICSAYRNEKRVTEAIEAEEVPRIVFNYADPQPTAGDYDWKTIRQALERVRDAGLELKRRG